MSKSQGCSDLSQGIFMCRHQVVLQPRYVPLLQCVTLHLISASKWLGSCFTFSHQQKALLIRCPSSWYSDPHHQAGDCSCYLLHSLLSGTRCELEFHCLHFSVATALICVFPSSCWYCSVDVSASCRVVVTGDNVGNVVLLSTSGEEVCMAPCSISSTGISMAHVLSYSKGTLKRGASHLRLRRWVHIGWWEILHFCHPVEHFSLLSIMVILSKQGIITYDVLPLP